MKNLALGALLVGLAAACGGGNGTVVLIDSGATVPKDCDPIAQTGCKTGEKCTWIVDANGSATMDEIGHNGCVAVDGSALATGATCTDAAAGVTGGADTCVAGDLCIAGVCKPICDPQAVTGAGACATDFSCAVYSGVFISGGAATAGVCEAGCDPLSQKLLVGSGALEACGSVDPTKPSGTCVPSQNFDTYHCAPSGAAAYTKTERQAPLTDAEGNAFANGCAPGFIPFFFKDASGSMQTICSGLCAALDTDADLAAATPGINEGDKNALGKLTTDATAVAGHATCDSAIKTKGTDAVNGEDCLFLWFFTTDSTDPKSVTKTQYSDTLGVCFAFDRYLVDADMNPNTPDVPLPSCATLPSPAKVAKTDLFGSAADNGCYSLTTTANLPAQTNVAHAAVRRPQLRAPLPHALITRHTFD